ncbi:hypothetical protein [Streptomyces sp. NPDC059909]|uniref:hypothetical protein n=1 Tax=Streptomyces sp. NPDC059909 TaxID=3346998 RepID=UPI0036642DC9
MHAPEQGGADPESGRACEGPCRATQLQIVGFVLVERNRERAPVQSPGEEELWATETAEHDPALARALARRADPEKLFAVSVKALVESLLAHGN